MATNLTQAMSQATLMVPPAGKALKTRTKHQVAKRVFQLAAAGGFPYTGQTYRDWAKKWLTSATYRLMEIDINAAASPHLPKNPERVAYRLLCEVNSTDPIVVDLNKQKTGKSHLGYIPEIVVLDGKHRKQGQMLQGRTRILAWVGCRAEKKIKNATVIKDIDFRNMTVPITTKASVIIQASHLRTANTIDTAYNLHCNSITATGSPKKDFSPVSKMRDKLTMKVNTKTGELGMPKQIKSGGPGSGRHAENHDLLTSHGWKPILDNESGKQYSHPSKSGYYMNRPSGAWSYRAPGESARRDYGRGDDPQSLQNHLSRIRAQGAGPGMSNQGGSGANPSGVDLIKSKGKRVKARDCDACTAAKSMGVLEEPDDSDEGLPSASDSGSRTEASDQRKYLFPREQIKAPGVKGWEGRSSPAQQSPGSGVGPRVARSTGGSRSEMSRLQDTVPEVNAHAKVVDKIYTKAPPGFSEKTMHELKRKHGTASAFKIAWSQYGGGK
jgi:hypothetical protein